MDQTPEQTSVSPAPIVPQSHTKTWAVAIGAVVLVLLITGAAFAYKYGNNQTSNQSQLGNDLASVAPQFVEDPLSSEAQKIKTDVEAVLALKEPDNKDYNSQLSIRAIAPQYVLFALPTGEGFFHDELLDAATQTVSVIPNAASYYSFDTKNIVVYIGEQTIYTYTLGESSFKELPDSQLTGSETYNSGESDLTTVIKETHTDTSLTVSVFDGSQRIADPGSGMMLPKKVRDVTFAL